MHHFRLVIRLLIIEEFLMLEFLEIHAVFMTK